MSSRFNRFARCTTPGCLGRLFSCGFVCLFALVGCSVLPMEPHQRTLSIPSPNHGERRPNFVIIHDTTSEDAWHALSTLTDPAREVSAHYMIGRDGTLYRLIDENRRAWHAGESWWGGNTDLNSSSVGIELDNTGDEPYPEIQINRLLILLAELKERHRIPAANFLGHGDVAPRRKVDPSRHFPWQQLALAGFGLWCVVSEMPDEAELPDPLLALAALGYETVDPVASLAAFRRRYFGDDGNGSPVSESERRWMACLLEAQRGGPAT